MYRAKTQDASESECPSGFKRIFKSTKEEKRVNKQEQENSICVWILIVFLSISTRYIGTSSLNFTVSITIEHFWFENKIHPNRIKRLKFFVEEHQAQVLRSNFISFRFITLNKYTAPYSTPLHPLIK